MIILVLVYVSISINEKYINSVLRINDPDNQILICPDTEMLDPDLEILQYR